LFLIILQEEKPCTWVNDVCYDVRNDCYSANNSVNCETYGMVISEKDLSIMECVWVEGGGLTIPKCISKVWVYFVFIYSCFYDYMYM
jgi:hypothetical protein